LDGTKNLYKNQPGIEPIKANYKRFKIIMLMVIILIMAIYLIF